MTSKFECPFNPQVKELKIWAYEQGIAEPTQDFDLFVAEVFATDLFLTLASDNKCPKRIYFLHILYLKVGDSIGIDTSSSKRNDVYQLLEQSKYHCHPDIIAWRSRAIELINKPTLFDYDEWCGGELAGLDWSKF